MSDQEAPPCPVTGREWVRVERWFRRDPGWIPRDVLERMGIDCSPLDRVNRMEQGTVWFTRDQADDIRRHREFEPIRQEGS